MQAAKILAAITLAFGLSAAHADTWPSRPITMVVPSAPGGSTDISARLVGDALSRRSVRPSSSTTSRARRATSAPRRSPARSRMATRC